MAFPVAMTFAVLCLDGINDRHNRVDGAFVVQWHRQCSLQHCSVDSTSSDAMALMAMKAFLHGDGIDNALVATALMVPPSATASTMLPMATATLPVMRCNPLW